MKTNYWLLLLFINIFGVFCSNTYAIESCNEFRYPDQYPYKNCGGVTSLTWDQEHSCEELGDNDSCTVTVAGGQEPYTWTISGMGFSFASGQLSVQTTENTVTVFTQDACGAGSIAVTDGCGTIVKDYIRSANGRWLAIDPPMDCLTGGTVTTWYWWGNLYYWKMETARYTQQQGINTYGGRLPKYNVETLTCDANPPASNYQVDADLWCSEESSNDGVPLVEGCTSGTVGAPQPYCAGANFPEWKATIQVSVGSCPWNSPTAIHYYCDKKCVWMNSNVWQEWKCN